MTTVTPSAPIVAPITEADVISFIATKARQLAERTGVEFANINVCVFNPDYTPVCAPSWTSYVDGDTHRTASRCDEAIAQSVAAMAPTNRAEDLRRRAAAMLAEAESLVAGGAL